MHGVNRRITLAARPAGFPKLSDFELGYAARPAPKPGEVLVRVIYLSLDPWLRGSMSGHPSAYLPIAVGEVLPGRAVGVVTKSAAPGFAEGEAVEGLFGWQEYATKPVAELRKLDPDEAPLSAALGVLGMPGCIGYFGMTEIGRPQPGETVLVSAATGGVGMVAGQVAKIAECRVVGSSGNEAAIPWLVNDLGFDAALSYAPSGDFGDRLAELCPQGVDVYFDNVGGEVTDAVAPLLNPNARVAFCGEVSPEDLESTEQPPWLDSLVARRVSFKAFQADTYADRFAEARARLVAWLHEGRLKYREQLTQGLAAAPQAFMGILLGKNLGKELVQVGER